MCVKGRNGIRGSKPLGGGVCSSGIVLVDLELYILLHPTGVTAIRPTKIAPHLCLPGWESLYPYTSDLMCLDGCRPTDPLFHAALSSVTTPLVIPAWEQALETHPDRAYAKYILHGLQFGFRIGFNRSHSLQSASANMLSARLHPVVIDEYLGKELALGRMLGPFPASFSLPELQINRFGVIPKAQSGKWRLITDLSFPPEKSVNDGIDPEFCSLSYTTVDQVAEVAVELGSEALLAKIDIESAYRLIPVHPEDRPLQAVRWQDQIFVDPMLPFGLRSAPKIFNAVADALHWHLTRCGIQHLFHYLDDFIMVASPKSPQCQLDLTLLQRECCGLGVPIAPHKTVGPTTCLVFLGIEIDTLAGELRLPQEKLSRLQSLLTHWGDKKVCNRKELESLIGLLNHACKVVRAGRSFLRRMIDLLHARSSGPSQKEATPIRLNTEFRADLAWWQSFVSCWNGISYLSNPYQLPIRQMASDASGQWGCGAYSGIHWFQVQWDGTSSELPITVKELLPILIAGVVWGSSWRDHQVCCYCDNQAVVACLRSRSSRHKGLMHLLRNLVFIEAHHGFHLTPQYIDTYENHLADDLSRDRAFSFLSKVPQASPYPVTVPQDLINLLLDPEADWVHPLWREQFTSTLCRV